MGLYGKKLLLRVLLGVIFAVLLLGYAIFDHWETCLIVGMGLALLWMVLYYVLWRCPYCNGLLSHNTKGTHCPHCGKDVGESMRI